MDEKERIGTQLAELIIRWLNLSSRGEQECILMLVRLLSDDRDQIANGDLPHYRRGLEEQRQQWATKENPASTDTP